MIENLTKVLPQLAFIAAFCIAIGWALRGAFAKPAAAKPAAATDAGKSERVKNLEAALEKSRDAHKATKTELENLQAASVVKAEHEAAAAARDAALKETEAMGKRLGALEAELRKAQETNKNLNARANEADNAQRDRRFALENELSKAREELAILQARPDDTTALQAEIERLREAAATSNRAAGESRKREAAAVEALEKAQARLAQAPAAPVMKSAPAGDSDRVAAAKAEVLRLLEENKRKAVPPVEPEPVAAEAPAKPPAPGELFTLG